MISIAGNSMLYGTEGLTSDRTEQAGKEERHGSAH